MSSHRHTELAYEETVEQGLLSRGYMPLSGNDFDKERAIFPTTVLDFIRETQPMEWAKLEALHGAKTSEQVLSDLCKWMDTYGSLATLRHGFKCYGRTLRVAFFKAAHELNPELEARYAANRAGLTRQLHYSARNEKKSLDLVLSVNGIPVATAELKNHLTGQTMADAVSQYQKDRDGPRADLRVQAADASSLRCRSSRRQHDHATGGYGDILSAIQSRARERGRQSTQPKRSPHGLPVGRGAGTGQFARPIGAFHPFTSRRKAY
jgi:hypothetical protein